ncbi:DUF3482 domain-containing protein [bacterium]|nr:DUF3482 domain-containing protein [bacterium]
MSMVDGVDLGGMNPESRKQFVVNPITGDISSNKDASIFSQSNNNISFNGTVKSSKDIDTLAKYASNVPVESSLLSVEGLGTSVGMIAGADCAIKGGSYLLAGKNEKAAAIENAKETRESVKEAKTIRQKLRVADRMSQSNEILRSIPQGEKLENLPDEIKSLYKDAQKAAEQAKSIAREEVTLGKSTAGIDSAAALKKANKSLAEAELASYNHTMANPKGFKANLSKYSGFSKLKKSELKLLAKFPVLKGASKFLGVGAIVISGISELLGNIIPAFQLGTESGLKQLGKSAVKVAASGVGMWAGAKAGAAIGAAIGSVFPGVGTAIGGVIGGAIGGAVGMFLAEKASDAVMGKSEVELAQEKEAENLAKQAKDDSTVLTQLVGATSQKLQADSPENEDAKIANESLKSLVSEQQKQNLAVARNRKMSAPKRTNNFFQTMPSANLLDDQMRLQKYFNQYGLA